MIKLIDANELKRRLREEYPLKNLMGRDTSKACKNLGALLDFIDEQPEADPTDVVVVTQFGPMHPFVW